MRGKIPKLGLLGALTVSMVGCSTPAPTQSIDAQRPTRTILQQEVPTIQVPEEIAEGEMVEGEDQKGYETQQRRRPRLRWRRTFYGGRPYWIPYYYYWWYPQPYYIPYYSGPYWYYYDRPGFGFRGRRFRRGRP